MKKILKIGGMHCESCAKIIEMELENFVNSIKVNVSKGIAEIDFDERKISENRIKEIISKAGYSIK